MLMCCKQIYVGPNLRLLGLSTDDSFLTSAYSDIVGGRDGYGTLDDETDLKWN